MDKSFYSSFDFDNVNDRIEFINKIKEDNLSIYEIGMILSNYKLDYYDNFEYLLEIYSKKYSVNLEHLNRLSKIVSLEIIKNLDNENIISILNANDNIFNKFIELFKKDNIKLNEYSVNNIFEAFAQRAYITNNHEIISAFNKTMHFISNKEYVNAKNAISNVFKDDISALEYSEYDINSLLEEMINGNHKAINFYHDVCNKRIDSNRNIFVKKEINNYKNDYLENSFETNEAIKVILKHFDYNSILKYGKEVYYLTDKERDLLLNEKLMKIMISFKNNSIKKITPEIKKSLYLFNRLMDKIYLYIKRKNDIIDILERENVKKIYKIPEPDKEFLLDVVCNIDFKKLVDVINDEDSYKGLSEMLNKYKFLSFHRNFEFMEIEADSYCDALSVSSIFSHYNEIEKSFKETNNKINMTNILDVADIYSDTSKKYELVFGQENFKYLTINPAPNRSITSKNDRREESLDNLKKAYERNIITIPSFDKNYELLNGKKINAVVGNFTNPVNLTLGERTGSCARSGGLGESLYNFCFNNENGFNIVFFDEDGNFVSKVSGFRNGNSVFLNQLRESVLKNYNNLDLVHAIDKVAEDLISMSKSSDHPIDNIVISEDRAMADSDYVSEKITFNSFFEKLGEEFWLDVSKRYAIVLKTSNDDNKLCEFKPGKENIENYVPVRDKIRISSNPNKTVAHMNALNDYLNTNNINKIKINEEDDYNLCYYGEDWYIAVNNKGDIISKVFDKSRNKKVAQEELNKVLYELLIVNNLFNEKGDKLK